MVDSVGGRQQQEGSIGGHKGWEAEEAVSPASSPAATAADDWLNGGLSGLEERGGGGAGGGQRERRIPVWGE